MTALLSVGIIVSSLELRVNREHVSDPQMSSAAVEDSEEKALLLFRAMRTIAISGRYTVSERASERVRQCAMRFPQRPSFFLPSSAPLALVTS